MGKKKRKERRHIRVDAAIYHQVDRIAIHERRTFSLQVELMLEMALHTLAKTDKRKAAASVRHDHG